MGAAVEPPARAGRAGRAGTPGPVGARIQYLVGADPARVRGFVLLWAATLGLMGAWGWTMPLVAIYLRDAGMSLGLIGTTQALTGLLTFLSQAPVGHLSDRAGRRRTPMVGAIAVTAILHGAIALTRHPLLLAAAVAIAGVATAAYITMMFASASGLARPEASGRAFSTYRVSGSIGWVLTSLSLGWVLGSIGARGAFVLSAMMHALVGIVLWRGLPELGGDHGVRGARGRGVDPAGGHPAALPGPADVLRMADVTLFLLGIALVTLAMQMGALYFPLYTRAELGASDALFGVLMALPASLEVPFMLWLGRASDRRGVHGLLVAGASVGAARWALVTLAPGPLHLLPLQALQAFAFSSMEVLGVSFVARRLDPAIRGTAVGLLVSFQGLGRIVAPLTGGMLGELWGLRTVFGLAGLASAAGAALFVASAAVRRGRTGRPADVPG